MQVLYPIVREEKIIMILAARGHRSCKKAQKCSPWETKPLLINNTAEFVSSRTWHPADNFYYFRCEVQLGRYTGRMPLQYHGNYSGCHGTNVPPHIWPWRRVQGHLCKGHQHKLKYKTQLSYLPNIKFRCAAINTHRLFKIEYVWQQDLGAQSPANVINGTASL